MIVVDRHGGPRRPRNGGIESKAAMEYEWV